MPATLAHPCRMKPRSVATATEDIAYIAVSGAYTTTAISGVRTLAATLQRSGLAVRTYRTMRPDLHVLRETIEQEGALCLFYGPAITRGVAKQLVEAIPRGRHVRYVYSGSQALDTTCAWAGERRQLFAELPGWVAHWTRTPDNRLYTRIMRSVWR